MTPFTIFLNFYFNKKYSKESQIFKLSFNNWYYSQCGPEFESHPGNKIFFSVFDHFYTYFDSFTVQIYYVNEMNATVVIIVELLYSILFFLILCQKCPISQVLTHSYTNLTWNPAFCTIYTPLIRFRSKYEFLPTLPIEYDHCAVGC